MDWLMVGKAFILGGIICVIGQILIDKTKLTPARILVTYVTVGAILGGLGWYKYLIDWGGCGASVPLTGFGNLLSKGAIDEIKSSGLVGAFTGGTKAAAGRNCCCCFFWIYCFFSFKTENKETVELEETASRLLLKLLFSQENHRLVSLTFQAWKLGFGLLLRSAPPTRASLAGGCAERLTYGYFFGLVYREIFL